MNATNLQMPCTVNQRVFDVPACGSLLLTDAQPELENYFIPGEEVLTYTSPEEAAELAQAYSSRPERALPIVARARRRVAAEHTYDHRLSLLLEEMRRGHAHGYLHPNTSACIGKARTDHVDAP
jgi:spore maturation protein CgeB